MFLIGEFICQNFIAIGNVCHIGLSFGAVQARTVWALNLFFLNNLISIKWKARSPKTFHSYFSYYKRWFVIKLLVYYHFFLLRQYHTWYFQNTLYFNSTHIFLNCALKLGTIKLIEKFILVNSSCVFLNEWK